MLSEGDKVATRWSATFTHSGNEFGPPTGKSFSLGGVSISQFRNGKILYGWNAQDFTSVLNQLR